MLFTFEVALYGTIFLLKLTALLHTDSTIIFQFFEHENMKHIRYPYGKLGIFLSLNFSLLCHGPFRSLGLMIEKPYNRSHICFPILSSAGTFQKFSTNCMGRDLHQFMKKSDMHSFQKLSGVF